MLSNGEETQNPNATEWLENSESILSLKISLKVVQANVAL